MPTIHAAERPRTLSDQCLAAYQIACTQFQGHVVHLDYQGQAWYLSSAVYMTRALQQLPKPSGSIKYRPNVAASDLFFHVLSDRIANLI